MKNVKWLQYEPNQRRLRWPALITLTAGPWPLQTFNSHSCSLRAQMICKRGAFDANDVLTTASLAQEREGHLGRWPATRRPCTLCTRRVPPIKQREAPRRLAGPLKAIFATVWHMALVHLCVQTSRLALAANSTGKSTTN